MTKTRHSNAASCWSSIATCCEWNPDDLSLQDPEKRTPLHAAAFLGDAEITELLILSGKTFWFFLFFVFCGRGFSILLHSILFLSVSCGQFSQNSDKNDSNFQKQKQRKSNKLQIIEF